MPGPNENVLTTLDAVSFYYNGVIDDQKSFITATETEFVIEEVHSRLNSLKERKLEFTQAILEAMRSGVSGETVQNYQRTFDENYFNIERSFIIKIRELEKSEIPTLHKNVLNSRLDSCETTMKGKDLTRGICSQMIVELNKIQADYTILANQELKDMKTPNEMKTATEKQKKFFERITKALVKFHQVKDGIEESRPAVRNNPKMKPLEIPEFDGNRGSWKNFQDMFVAYVHESEMKPVEKLGYLQMFIKDPMCPIKSWSRTAADYDEAWKTVCEFYDDNRLTIAHHFDGIFKIKSASEGSYEKIQAIVNEARLNFVPLHRLCEENEIDFGDAMIAHVVLHKLDDKTKDLWAQEHKNEIPLWSNLCSFLEQRAKDLYVMPAQAKKSTTAVSNYKQSTSYSSVPSSSKGPQATKCFFSNTGETGGQKPMKHCPLSCPFSHPLFKCQKLKALSPDQRRAEIEKLSRCTNCLSKHALLQCTKESMCREPGCNEKHHTLLHKPKDVVANTASAAIINESVLFSTMVVYVRGNGNEWHKARAMTDTGATACFMRKCFADALKLKTFPCHVAVSGLTDANEPLIVRRRLQTYISNENGDPKHSLNFYLVPKVTQQTPARKIPLDAFGIPDNCKLADPHFNVPAPIDILLGNNIAKLLETGEIIDLKNGVQIFGTIFGYALAGGISSSEPTASRRITTAECNMGILKELNANIQKFWQIEDYKNEKRSFTNEEVFCEEHFQRTFKRLLNGKFQVTIPFKPSLDQLGDNSKSAYSQFMSTEKKMKRDAEARKGYVEFMREYLESGDMTEVLVARDKLPPGYYLPHHPVYKPDSTTTKTRVVFNASSKGKEGYSLNDVQCTGPVIQSDSTQLIVRFRQHKTVIKGDISKFYRTVEVEPSQRKYQRIFWRESENDPLKTFELNTVTYGESASSFLSTRCLKQLAVENKDKYPESSRIIEQDFFVDDLLSGAATPEVAIKLKNEISKILDSAHMKLRKFISNSPEFINSLPEEDRETCTNTSANFKALGCVWNPDDDVITFSIEYKAPGKMTKRTILATIAKPMALDPTGLIAPVILKFKVFMKKIHQLRTAWDVVLPDSLSDEWEALTHTLEDVNKIRIPRRVIIENHKKLQLICCCDASVEGYGACLYVRTIDEDGNINCQLLKAKSHVAQDGVEMPKLELCALVVAATLIQVVEKDFIYPIDEKIILSDSTIALSWIKNGAKGQSTFVFNRAQKIRQLAEDVKFMHVRTDENPADWVSRGLLASEIYEDYLSNQFWWRGPAFLMKTVEEWPEALIQFNLSDNDFDDYLCENDPVKCLHTTINTEDTDSNMIFNIVEKSKTFIEAKRKIASITKLISLCKAKVSKSQHLISHIGLSDLKNAESIIAREYQRVYMPCEFRLLSTGKNIQKSSKYHSSSPFWHADQQVIRGGGRNQNANVHYNQRHPIILPKCPLSHILAREAHRQLMHAGKDSIIVSVKLRYHPLSFASIARNVVKKCNECFRNNVKFAEQFMAPLPASRVNPAPAFHITGIDFAGPFSIKTSKLRNAKIDKAYLALFICFATKAVHLEVVSSLTTEDFTMALNRFINRRGRPFQIWTDHGGNFLGCNNELQRVHDFLKAKRKDFTSYFNGLEIQWKYIPPRSPNHGGLWEANIKIAKRHLYTTYMDANLTFEELTTVCTRIEAVMNSRPLISATDDPNDFRVITPSHLICGKSITSLPEADLSDCKFQTLQRYDRVLKIQQEMWKLLMREHIATHRQRQKNRVICNNVHPGLKVLLHVDNTPSLHWPVGKIVQVYPGRDNLIRVVDVQTADGIYKRAISKIAVLPTQDEDENV